jgi:hypothetical protein
VLNTLLLIYLIGCGVVMLIFTIMLAYLYANGSEDARIIFRWYSRIMPEYVFFWPWRCVLFQLWNWPQIRKMPLR